MIPHPPADAAPDAAAAADRLWFEAHPGHRDRLRPTALAELLPGEAMRPGSRTVVARCGSSRVRLRVRVGRPPPDLRLDTDRCCAALLRRLDEAATAAVRAGGLGRAIVHLQREPDGVMSALRRRAPGRRGGRP